MTLSYCEFMRIKLSINHITTEVCTTITQTTLTFSKRGEGTHKIFEFFAPHLSFLF